MNDAAVFAFFSFVWLIIVVQFRAQYWRAKGWTPAVDRRDLEALARLLDDPRTSYPPHQGVIEGGHRGERVRLTKTSGQPGTMCQLDCVLPRALWGTLCAGVTPGAPPRVVGAITSTLPAAFTTAEAAAALRTLLERCTFVRVSERAVDARLVDETFASGVISALAALVRALRAAAPETSVDLHERTDVSADCPYCRAPLGDREPRACERCGTQHHLECLLEHGRCTVLACDGGRFQRVQEAG